MTKLDKYGVEIEVGDIVVFTTSSKGGGGLTVGVIDKVSPDHGGHMSIRYRVTRDQKAWEIGAPQVSRMSRRPKRNEDGSAVLTPGTGVDWRGRPRMENVYEEYEHFYDDYTLTGKKIHFWRTSVIWTPSNVLILRKHNWAVRPAFTELMNLNYSKTEEELNA